MGLSRASASSFLTAPFSVGTFDRTPACGRTRPTNGERSSIHSFPWNVQFKGFFGAAVTAGATRATQPVRADELRERPGASFLAVYLKGRRVPRR